jgi:mRNA-degrading endonuclease toxin of MazEF toxin-antitoxin module
MNVSRGDIVLANVPFIDRTGAQKRPGLVVSTDKNNTVIDDMLLAVTSRVSRQGAFTDVTRARNCL